MNWTSAAPREESFMNVSMLAGGFTLLAGCLVLASASDQGEPEAAPAESSDAS